MQAFLAILRYDAAQLTRSWLLRIWLALLVAPAVFLVAVAANEQELASETLAAYLAAVYAPFTAIAVSVLAAGAVSGEASVIADSFLSKSVTRAEYMWAKIVARLGVTLGVFLIVLVPFTLLVVRYGVPDTSTGGLIVGLLMVGALVAFLSSAGIMLSTLLSNVLVSVLVLLVGVLASGVLLQFMGLHWLSATAVFDNMPGTLRGDTPLWDSMRVLVVFSVLAGGAVYGSLRLFHRRDL